jgi:hypothetical protein
MPFAYVLRQSTSPAAYLIWREQTEVDFEKFAQRREMVKGVFAYRDGVSFEALEWPCKGKETVACIVARSDATKATLSQAVHLQALDDVRMLDTVAAQMASKLAGTKASPKRRSGG